MNYVGHQQNSYTKSYFLCEEWDFILSGNFLLLVLSKHFIFGIWLWPYLGWKMF